MLDRILAEFRAHRLVGDDGRKSGIGVRVDGRRLLVLLVLLVLQVGTSASGASASSPEWAVSGSWSSPGGDLRLSQASDGALIGSFVMRNVCTETYAATGRIDGTAISLGLVRASGPGNQPPCAGTQTLTGNVEPGGMVLTLTLANFAQTSPASPFTGQARRLGADSAFSKSVPVHVTCGVGQQLCPRAFVEVVRPPAGTIAIRFTMSTGHCSHVRVRISVDGGPERVSPFLGPGATTPEYTFRVSAGPHRVQVRAEGRIGGCNHGDLQRWAGTLFVRSTA